MPIKILLTTLLLITPLMATQAHALKWMPNWFTCEKNDDCTYVDHPCRYIAVNKAGVAGANKIIAFDAPYIDCNGEDLTIKRAMKHITTFCNPEKKCAITPQQTTIPGQTDTNVNGE